MSDVLSMGTKFSAETVKDLFSKVKGHSSVTTLTAQDPIAFSGSDYFVFSMDDEVNIVAENGTNVGGSAKMDPVKIVPLKVEYGARVSDEFMYASEEKQIDMLMAFNDGAARKIARGIDIMAMHGFNPRDKAVSTIIGTNCFDKACAANKVVYDAANIDANVEDAIALLGADADVTGIAMSPTMRAALSKLTDKNGNRLYPQLAWGAKVSDLNGTAVDINSTVNFGTSKDHAIIGDFGNALRWGYAKEIPMEIIPYGDPDGSGKDLKANHQVYLSITTFVGWGILDPNSFALIEAAA